MKVKYIVLSLIALFLLNSGCQKSDSNNTDNMGWGQLIVNGISHEVIEFNCPMTLVDGQDKYCNYTLMYEDNGSRWSLIVSFDDSCESIQSGNIPDFDVYLVNQSNLQDYYEDEGDIDVVATATTIQFSNIELINVIDESKVAQVSTSGQIACNP